MIVWYFINKTATICRQSQAMCNDKNFYISGENVLQFDYVKQHVCKQFGKQTLVWFLSAPHIFFAKIWNSQT